jgi:hypothetical protein
LRRQPPQQPSSCRCHSLRVQAAGHRARCGWVP